MSDWQRVENVGTKTQVLKNVILLCFSLFVTRNFFYWCHNRYVLFYFLCVLFYKWSLFFYDEFESAIALHIIHMSSVQLFFQTICNTV